MSAECDNRRNKVWKSRATGREIDNIGVMVGRAFSVRPEVMLARRRGNAREAFARQVALYLSCTGLGLSLTAVAARFGRDRTTVAYACRVIEKRRDDPRLDAILGMLERALGVTPKTMSGLERSVVRS